MKRNERLWRGVRFGPPLGPPLSCLMQCVEKWWQLSGNMAASAAVLRDLLIASICSSPPPLTSCRIMIAHILLWILRVIEFLYIVSEPLFIRIHRLHFLTTQNTTFKLILLINQAVVEILLLLSFLCFSVLML